MSHYFKNDSNLGSKTNVVLYDFKGERLKFITDLGVFSKERIDFGTNVLLNSIHEEDIENKKVLDVGCGYGIIGLSIAKRYKNSFVEMVDVNLRAIELAKQNKESNKIDNARIYESNAYERVSDLFDCILTNPPIRAGKDVVHTIVLESVKHLNEGGNIYLVIQKKQGAPSLIKEMENVFLSVEVVNKKNGYYILKGIKK